MKYFKHGNRITKEKKVIKLTTLKSVEIVVFIASTLTSGTLSVTGIGLIATPTTTVTAFL